MFIIFLAILNIFIVQALLGQSKDIAAVVNVIGKMRLLSQQASLQFLVAKNEPSLNLNKAKVYEDSFEDAFRALSDGGTVFGKTIPPVQPQQQEFLYDIQSAWIDYVFTLDYYRDDESQIGVNLNKDDVKKIVIKADKLLSNIELLIDDLLASYNQVHKRINYISYALFIFDLIILLLIYKLFIGRVIAPIEILSEQSNKLAAGDYSARTNFATNDEFGELSAALDSSSAHIESLLLDLEKRQKRLDLSNDMFEGLASNTVAGIYMLDESLKFVYVNQQLANMLKTTKSVLENNFYISNLFSSDDFTEVMRHIDSRTNGDVDSSHYEVKAIRVDGTTFDAEIFGSIMHTESGVFIIGLALDISARKADELSLRRALLIYQNSSEGMFVTDKDGFIIDVNAAFENITSYSAGEILGKRLSTIGAAHQSPDTYEEMWRSIDKTGYWNGDIVNLRKSGEEFVEHLKLNTIYNEDGTVHSHIGLFSDVTERRRKEAAVWHQANYDSLTKLPNRFMFQHSLEQEILHAKRNENMFAVLFLDLDYFKDINDTYGHDEGDQLLRIMANRLKSALRKTDLVARLGGDEFTIILKNINSVESIVPIANKIVEAVGQSYKLKSNTVNISASTGIAIFPLDGENSEILLKKADLAMYAAKEKGRNQYSFFTENLLLQANTRGQLIKDINLALMENQFELYYQPIVELATGDMAKCEALIRWHHPEKGLIKPNDFIGLAESTNQINAIGNWVFEQSVKQIVKWQQELNKNITISINVSPVQFENDHLNPEQWLKYLFDKNIATDLIVIEVTERLFLDTENSSHTLEKLNVFNKAGLRVALDDFGTGYSSLSHLNKLTADFLKIDRSYINDLTIDSESYVLCQAIIVMAHELNIQVIAEGVSTKEQHDLLLKAGCDYGQGYFYNRPMPVTELNNLLISKEN